MYEGDLAPAQASTVVFGSFGRRLGAALLDSMVWLIAIGWFLGAFPQDFFDDHKVAAGLILFGLFTAWFNYFAICEWRTGQTIGKNAFGLRVVPVDAGAKLTYNAAAIRNLLRLVDLPLTLIGVDYLIVRNSPRKQRLGDRAARTVVLREPPVAATDPAQENPPPPGPSSGELFPDAAGALREAGLAGSGEGRPVPLRGKTVLSEEGHRPPPPPAEQAPAA